MQRHHPPDHAPSGPCPSAAGRPPVSALDGERILIERLVVARPRPSPASWPSVPAADRPALVERGRSDRPARAPGRRRHRQRRRRPGRVREAHAPGRAGQREGRRRRSSRPCAPTSPTATAACRARSSSSSATAARCATMVDELFDETKRDSAIGRIGTMLERYFDGDASKLAVLLDPTRLHSPMHQFRQEMTDGLQVARGAARRDRGGRRRPRRRACPVDRQGRRLRGPARGDAGRPRPRRRRPARPDRHGRRARS